MKKRQNLQTVICTVILCCIISGIVFAQSPKNWHLVIPKDYIKEEAVKVVLNDLESYAKEIGIEFRVTDDNGKVDNYAIIVGGPNDNKTTAALQSNSTISLKGIEDDEGYEIITKNYDNHKIIIIAGNTVISNVYGLYWLWDRMRIYKYIPDINIVRIPALKTRMSLAWGRRPFGGGSKETMQQALRQSINWVSGIPILDLVPWNSEPENNINRENRIITNELIDYAHSLKMKYFCFANEFTYHPSLLKENDAILSPM